MGGASTAPQTPIDMPRSCRLLADKLALQGHMHHGGQGVQLRGKEAEASGQVPIQAYSAEP